MADDFASMFESSPTSRRPKPLEAGQAIEGTVIAISGGLVILDIGSSADATIDLLEFEERPVAVGDTVRATVAHPRKDGPILTLSLGKGGSGINTATLQLALESGTPVSGTVTESNKGGFSVEVAGVRAFCPISQIDANYVNDPQVFVGQTFDFVITEIREGGKNVVLSRRKLLEQERRAAEDEMVKSLTVGGMVTGTVKKTIQHGAIISLGGVDGFIPISELSRARVDKAEDVVTVGEQVQAQVLTLERTEKGLSVRLSLKALDHSTETTSGAQVDEILDGKVVKHVPGGVIVATSKGEGLVPTRELSLAPGADHRRAYPVDTELRVVVVNRDAASGKLRLSVGKVAQVEERRNYRDFGGAQKSGGKNLGSLGDLMAGKLDALQAQAQKNAAKSPVSGQAAAKEQPAAGTPVAPPSPAASVSPKESGSRKGAEASQGPHQGVHRRRR